MFRSVVIVFVRNHYLNIVNGTAQPSDHRARSTVGRSLQRRVLRCPQLRAQQLCCIESFYLITCIMIFETEMFC